ncbi:hypothetical protein BJ508DRAFT_33277 [Ascobolus immersus RN42]|uniref:Geranylgeranyl pyrophosphate synthetase n=1 Tax=Ascobolus immersus RN42 TaxID=1160509 RepID=A0A3N4HRJ2_ASCIM|nr:hypothetical protein BJ508DRAFT_33277 [Ascobolus immersus RN42]
MATMPNLKPLESILRSSLTSHLAPSVTKENFKQLTSYNWLRKRQGKAQTMVVPGHPPIWTPPLGTQTQLKPNTTFVYPDDNAARSKAFPMEPLFRSLAVSDPKFSFTDISIISDRTSLLRLLDFASGRRIQGRKHQRKFILDVQRFGNLIMMSHRVEKPKRKDLGGGFGISFENEFAKWPRGLQDSTRHYRVVQYTFCGMNMIVRSEADAAVIKRTPALSGIIKRLTFPIGSCSNQDPVFATPGSSFLVRRSGTVIPESCIADMKTYATSANITATYSQMWFSNTSYLIRGQHTDGLFENIAPVDCRMSGDEGGIICWEKKNEGELRKLGNLLETLRTILKERSGAFTVQYVDRKALLVEEDPGKDWLPKDVAEWVTRSSSKS